MIKFGFFMLGFAAFCATNDVTLSGDYWKYVIHNPSSFGLFATNETWTINTDSNSTIKIYCPELYINSKYRLNNTQICGYSNIVFSDGVKDKMICISETDLFIQGQTSKMVVNLTARYNGGAVTSCLGKSVHPPRSYETINVSAGETVRVNYPKVLGKEIDQAFIFNSTSGSPITLECTKKMTPPLKSGLCIKDILTIDNGNRNDVSCGKGQVSATGTQIKMRVEIYQDTKSQVSCVARG